MASDLDLARQELLPAAEALGSLLQGYGVQFWADWITQDRRRVEAGDECWIDHLLRAYGGMGSLNDVVIHPANGHYVTAADIGPANGRLAKLRSRTYAAATRLKVELARTMTPPPETSGSRMMPDMRPRA